MSTGLTVAAVQPITAEMHLPAFWICVYLYFHSKVNTHPPQKQTQFIFKPRKSLFNLFDSWGQRSLEQSDKINMHTSHTASHKPDSQSLCCLVLQCEACCPHLKKTYLSFKMQHIASSAKWPLLGRVYTFWCKWPIRLWRRSVFKHGNKTVRIQIPASAVVIFCS